MEWASCGHRMMSNSSELGGGGEGGYSQAGIYGGTVPRRHSLAARAAVCGHRGASEAWSAARCVGPSAIGVEAGASSAGIGRDEDSAGCRW